MSSHRIPPAFAVLSSFLFFSVTFLGFTFLSVASVDAASFTVNSLADNEDDDLAIASCADVGGNCTLRAAIEQINFTGDPSNTIDFSVAGTIAVGTGNGIGPFPQIRYRTTIDGYSAPGSAPNTIPFFISNATLTLILDGASASFSDGLSINHLTDPTMLSEGSVIQGLVIRNFGGDGIELVTGYNQVRGCFIGIDADGSTDVGNGGDGISITSSAMVGGFNIIGGQSLPAHMNVISGNGGDGIQITGTATNNEIRRNIIGVGALGVGPAVPNDEHGINIGTGDMNQIGGLVVHSSNLISGNGESGVRLGTDSNRVEGNYIGVDATGLVAIPNQRHGVEISNGSDNVIGLPLNLQIISGNSGYGVSIVGASANGNSVVGNYIGVVNPLVAQPLGNGCSGILITSGDNIIGGGTNPFDPGTSIPGDGNLIGGNTDDDPNNHCQNPSGHGIEIRGSSASGNLVLGNYIGTDFNAALDLGNLRDGIALDFNANNNQIGDGSDLGANRIDFNGDLGIDLDNDGPDTNDDMDPDGGVNGTQNYPVIASAVTSMGSTMVQGTLNSTPLTEFFIQVFSSDTADLSGFGEGRRFEGSLMSVTTDATGNSPWMLNVSGPEIAPGRVVTAVATPTSPSPGPTSEFSATVEVTSPGEIQFTSAAFLIGESGGNAMITVERVNGTGGAVSVDYATSDGTAMSGVDYSAATGTLSWADGVGGSMTFLVPITPDLLDEDDETVSLTLSNPQGGAPLGTPDTAELTITDDDAPPMLSINDVSMPEGDAATTPFSFDVTLSAASGKTVSVNYATTDDSAVAPGDYAALPAATLNFLPGEISQSVTVQVVGETTPESDESFFVDLTSPVNATLADGQGLGTIEDDDTLPNITIDDVTLSEGDAGTASFDFTVTLSAPFGSTVSVDYATADGTATAGDYTSVPTTQLDFLAGETMRTVSVAVTGDLLDEPDETFFVNLSNPTNGNITDNQGVGLIQDDDAPPALSIDDVTLAEGDAGTTAFAFTVMLDAPSGQMVSVDYATADDSATAGSDYNALATTTLTFLAGETSQMVTVDVLGDGVPEPNETFFVNLTNPVAATLATSQGVGTIVDDDTVPQILIDDVTVTETDAGTVSATFTLTLTQSDPADVTVDYQTSDGTATAGSDYQADTGTLTFTSPSTSETLTVEVVGDVLDEIDETFFVDLSNPSANAAIADPQGQGTITDDDPLVDISISDVMLPEGDAGTTAFDFAVTLSAPSGRTVTVDYATADGTATAPGDYTAIMATLTFNPGDVSQLATVSVNGDTMQEGDETFQVDLSAPVNANVVDGSALGTIQGDDQPTADLAVTQAFSSPSVMVGDTVDLTVSILNSGPDPATGVTLMTTLPLELSLISAPPGCTEVAGVVTCSLGPLAVGVPEDVVLVLGAQSPGSVSVESEAMANEADLTPADNVLSTGLLISGISSIENIPTLSDWGTLLLILLLATAAASRLAGPR
ncbi:MAG: hypothetical protein MPN21_12800 [Thermoanaerobaculia bacterium]|nr:hypothetical protein [Thermoanaerobaculia bacterium]